MLRLTAICLAVFSFIAGIYFTVPVLFGAPGRELSFAIAFVVEFMALFSVAVGFVIYDTTGRRQLLCVALGMIAQFVGDGVNLAAPMILAHLQPGWLWALFSDVSWFVLLSRVVANGFFLVSLLRANVRDNICRSDQIWIAIPVILGCVIVVQLALSLVSPNFAYDFSHVFSNMMILPLLGSTVLALMALSGYLMRVIRRPAAFEVLFTLFLLNAVYHHMAFMLFDETGRNITEAFLMPSRLFSYGFVLIAMVAALRDLYRSASQASSAKSAFLATMSHEIRTPLNGVLGMAQLLRQTNLNQIQRERVNAILSSGRALMTLLNDILDMSKIEAGHADIEIRPFRPYDVTCDLSSAILALTQEKNLKLVWDDKILRNRIFMGDEVRFRQVLWNLLSNAVKFTRKGSVHLVVEYDPSRAGGRIPGHSPNEVYRFSVSDTGIGIAPERQERIFQAFTQGDSSTMRQFGGTGLGLSISQNLIRMMGGHIGLHSVPGQGTRFDCWLPFDVRSVTQDLIDHDKARAEENPIGILADKRVLVVEDNEINANVMSAFLERMGLKVDIVGNGRLAVQAFQKNKYDVILMDAHMPVLDGEGATRHIREIERESSGGRVPVIGVTADVFADRQRDFLAAGMDEVLTKPIEERRLYASLVHHLRGRGDLLDLTGGGSSATAGTDQARSAGPADIPWQTLSEIRAAARGQSAPKTPSEVEGAGDGGNIGTEVAQENGRAARWPETAISGGVPPKQDLPAPVQQHSALHLPRKAVDLSKKNDMLRHRSGQMPDLPAETDRAAQDRTLVEPGIVAGATDTQRDDEPDTNTDTTTDADTGIDTRTETDASQNAKSGSDDEVVWVNKIRMQEMLDALGREQMITLIKMLPDAYREECDRMVGAIATNDTVAFRRAAHSLKGMAANLAADEIARRARDLEYFDGPLDQTPAMIREMDDILQQTMQRLLAVTADKPPFD